MELTDAGGAAIRTVLFVPQAGIRPHWRVRYDPDGDALLMQACVSRPANDFSPKIAVVGIVILSSNSRQVGLPPVIPA
jgi:hypothetical protein